MADPVLELHAPSGFTTIMNDNWRDDPAQEAAIIATGIPPTHDLESAIVATLAPGAYTAIIRGNNNGTGIGLVEVYDLSAAVPAKLANISTRALVGIGSNIVIAGFILGGMNSGDDHVIVRGIGGSLALFGVPNPLANPALELRDSNAALLVSNNDWQDNAAQAAEITAAGLALSDPLESGISATLAPGQYTVLLSGQNATTGAGLVEVYDLGAGGGPGPSPTPGGTPMPIPSAQAINLSTRMNVQTGNNVGISGFIITGSAPKYVLLRAIGPSLQTSPTPAPTATPMLTPPPTPTATATATATATPVATPAPSPAGPCIENFDGVSAPALPPGWTTTNPSTSGPDPLWVTSPTIPHTPPNDAAVKDSAMVSDKRLDTPGIAVTSGSAKLSFRNYFNLQDTLDGGVLEVSSPNIAGGEFTDITSPVVGGSFDTGGYNQTINGMSGNPLAGRMAWSGDSGGYIRTVVKLGPNINGQTIKLRFRLGTSDGEAVGGWRIDTFLIAGAACP